MYSNIACVFLSQDKDGEVWVHFGVELRGIEHIPHLSTFGGKIDAQENPLPALVREIHEETLGLMDPLITTQKLTTPEQTYSYSYTNPTDMTSTVVFATMVDHDKLDTIKNNFSQERHERLYKKNGKLFHTVAETEVKEIRSVKLSELKKFLAARKENPDVALRSADASSIMLSIDKNSIKLDDNEVLKDYAVYQSQGKPVETVIAQSLPLREGVAKSLEKILPGLEYRFFNKPILPPFDMKKNFYGKSLRADEFCYIDEFLDTLPIKGLTTRERVSLKRQGKRKAMTARGTEIIDLRLKNKYGIGKQYTDAQKASFSDIQSTSFFSVTDGSPVFGFSKDRNTRLVGVAGLDILPNRLYVYDGGTVSRPYDGHDNQSLAQYIQTKALSENAVLFDTSDFDLFTKKIADIGSNSYNEVLARVRWDENTSICVFSDNQESLWIAIAWAKKIEAKIKEKCSELLEKGLINQEEFQKFQRYEARISFYNSEQKRVGSYSKEILTQAIQKAVDLFDNLDLRQQALQNAAFEFLLMINDEARLSQIVSAQSLIKELLNKRPYIAEDIIQKYYNLTGKSFHINETKDLTFTNLGRSFLEKLNKGIITGFPVAKDGRFLLQGNTFELKDFSGMDLTKFNLSGTTFKNCAFRKVNLDLKGNENITFTDCDFRGTNTKQIDFSGCKINGYFTCDDPAPNFQLMEKIDKKEEYYENFDLEEMINLLKSTNNPTDDLIEFVFKLALFNHNDEALKLLLEEYDVIGKIGIDDPSELFMLSAKTKNVKVMQSLFAKFPNTSINLADTEGTTLLHFAALNANHDMITYLLSEGANIEAIDYSNTSVLAYAIHSADPSVLDLLYNNGIKINRIHNVSPLHFASVAKLEPMFLKLLDYGADPANDSFFHIFNNSILMMAAISFSGPTIQKLIDKGADVNQSIIVYPLEQEGTTALMIASRVGNLDAVQVLLKNGAKIDATNVHGIGALDHAINGGHEQLFNLLLPLANPQQINQALNTAAKYGRDQMLAVLLNKGADLNAVDYLENTALDNAALFNRINAFNTLLEKASLEAINRALVRAASTGNDVMLKTLIKKGADVNAKDQYGRTALMEAARKGDLKTIQVLLENKADLNALDNFNKSALSIAANNGHAKVFDYLKAKGATWDNAILAEEFLDAANRSDMQIVKTLLPLVSDNFIEKNLSSLAKIKDAALFSFIISNKPNIDLESEESFNIHGGALYAAASLKRIENIEALCEAGANIDISNPKSGTTALMNACKDKNVEVVEKLLKFGANTDLKNVKGETAVSIAKSAQNQEILDLLEKYQNNRIAQEEQRKRTESRTMRLNEVKKSKIQTWDQREAAKQLRIELMKNNVEMARLIIMAKPDATVLVTDQDNAFTLAIQNKQFDIARMILEAKPEAALMVIGRHNALTRAMENEQFDIARMIIEAKPEAALVVIDQYNPLTSAIQNEQFDMAEFIAQKCPDAVLYVNDGWYLNGNNSLTKAIDLKNETLATNLFKSAPKAAMHVIQNGDNAGHTALSLAIKEGYHDLAMRIFNTYPELAHQVIGEKDFLNQGFNCLMLAIKKGNKELALKIITTLPQSINHVIPSGYQKNLSTLDIAISNNQPELALLLIEKSVNLESSDNNQMTTLHRAIQWKMDSVITHLIDKGVNINAITNQGHTPLIFAVIMNSKDIVVKLIQAGADLSIQDMTGKTALDHASGDIKEIIEEQLTTRSSKKLKR